MLASTLDSKQYLEKALSSSSRKKLRQHRRRLAERGDLESKIITEPDALAGAVEEFLRLEAAGWKGRKRTALLCHPPDATFTREMMASLASHGDASIHALYLDGRPASMQIVLRAGPAAFTWKTAYDESLQGFSPGMLLLEDYTSAFLADPSITHVDSCAHDDSGFMASWSERQQIAELWIDARRGGSASFAHLSRLQDIYLRLRTQVKAAYRTGIRRQRRQEKPDARN
jgi:CelD/BcsL family acetyltransferase involved in cellulose biosynthesis